MTSIINKISATPNPIANDGSQPSVVSATVYTDGAPAVAGIDVTWTSVGGVLTDVTSATDATGVATISVSSNSGVSSVTVTAKTADDATGRTATISTYIPYVSPTVLNATEGDNYTLDHDDIHFGVQAEIPIYTGISMNQKVTFYWGDIDSLQFIITEDLLPPFVIDVSNNMSADCLKDGKYNVYYSVADLAGNIANSSPLAVTVADGGQTAPTEPLPSVPEADPYININDASDGVDIIISYPELAVDDLVTFYWTGYDSAQRKITNADTTGNYTVVEGDTQVTFFIDSSYFYPNGKGYNGYAEVYYTVQSAGGAVLALSETLNCLVDTLVG